MLILWSLIPKQSNPLNLFNNAVALFYPVFTIYHILLANNASLYHRNPMPNFLTTYFLFRTNSILEKYEVGLFMVLGFGGFSVLIALVHNWIRKYVYGDAGSLDTMFDAGGKVSLSLTAVTVTSQALWPSVFLEMPMLTYLVCLVDFRIFCIQVYRIVH